MIFFTVMSLGVCREYRANRIGGEDDFTSVSISGEFVFAGGMDV